MKLNFLNSKKKKAAILYIQPIEYEDAGMMTSNISIPAEDEVSPMKPTPFPKFAYYPQSKSIEMKSPSNVLDTIVDSSPKSDKGKANKQQPSGQKVFQNIWEAPYEASPKMKKQMQESFLYLSEPPSKTTSMSVDTQIRTNRQSQLENLQSDTNQYPSTVILRKRTKQKNESHKITPYLHPQVKKPFKILKNPSPFEGHAQLSKSQDLEHIVRKKKQNNDTAQDQLVIQRMMSYLKKHKDSVKISESVSDATPLNESELISKFNNFDEISDVQKTIDLRQSVRQWGQQTIKLNILEPRLPFMSANRKQLERILSETKQSRQEKIFTNLKRVQDSRTQLNSSVVTLASPQSQEELHPYVGISKGRGQISTQLLGNLFINTEHSSKKSVLLSKSSVPSQQSDNAGGSAIFSRRIECVQNRKNNRSIGLPNILQEKKDRQYYSNITIIDQQRPYFS
ncbi:hypothetical protein FGO68_gene12861 [Halteria grandinella]|uniref:Uncharacterized protein n=1 Tax=Halteria grandinella TaxID=5974 RepID=A0A8J8T5N4_HALGN|nr:hypothetical protein FGO68_gene12861 [Halteria grandinella]